MAPSFFKAGTRSVLVACKAGSRPNNNAVTPDTTRANRNTRISTGTLTTNGALYQKLNFDPIAFEPVAVLSKFPNVLLVRQDFPAATAQEFIVYAKANPGKLNYASQGVGTTSHLTAELFISLTGAKVTHVPYRGTAPALNDIIAGHVDFIFMELSSAVKLHEGKKARILAVATEKRLDILPDVPTLIEVGVPDFISDTWNAISAPPKTWEQFEELCADTFAALWSDHGLVRHGRSGQRQQGVDIIKLYPTGGHGLSWPSEVMTMSSDEIEAATQAAHERGKKIRGHITSKQGILAGLAAARHAAGEGELGADELRSTLDRAPAWTDAGQPRQLSPISSVKNRCTLPTSTTACA